jgi:RNA polymerase sigma factor (TIGR02999 family)
MTERENITRLLSTAARDPRSAARLYDAVYNELQALARASMRRESSGHTLQPTALVNEAYLRLLPSGDGWENRGHFFGVSAQMVRGVLVDMARGRGAWGRCGPGVVHVPVADVDVPDERPDADLVGLDRALEWLPGVGRDPHHSERLVVDPRAARLIPPGVFHAFGFRRVRKSGETITIARQPD